MNANDLNFRKNIFNKNNNEIYTELSNISHAEGYRVFDISNEQKFDLSLFVDDKIAPGLFKPDPENPKKFHANSITIRALKKDILLAGEDFDEFTHTYVCEKCKKELDLQFWHFCPFCEEHFRVQV
ncbi:MAG: hypothetical protein HQK49_11440 [Oligoflexia bacterium]|nr:hypothetical protein [Oligoflexia bacterium]